MNERVFALELILTALGVAMLASGCGRQAAPASPQTPPATQVTAGKPERKTISLTTTQPGQIEAFEQTPLFAKIAGYVEELFVDIGDLVKKDQVLVRLSVPELHDDLRQKEALVVQAEAEVQQAESTIVAFKAAVETAQSRIVEAEAGIARANAELERWKSEHARIKELADRGAVTKKLEEETLNELRSAEASTQEAVARAQSTRTGMHEAQANVGKGEADKVAAEARLQVSKADLARAKTMLAYTEIKAPYDGTVTRRMVDTGHYVHPANGAASQPLMVVARTDVVRIFVDVPELEAARVDSGDPVVVHVQALEEKTFEAQVVRTSWSLLESNHSLRAEIDVPNPTGLLRPGMYATVTIRLEVSPNAITVPLSAVVREGGDAYCICVDSGKIERRPVQLGLRSGDDIQVLSGLDADQLVVLKQPDVLRQGQSVQVASPSQ
jgi:RND family efflux transporter MFP subunit